MSSTLELLAEREKKQIFLKDEIMDKGFDTDWFADFISTKRGKSLLNFREWNRC
jgi:hypothetical protein